MKLTTRTNLHDPILKIVKTRKQEQSLGDVKQEASYLRCNSVIVRVWDEG